MRLVRSPRGAPTASAVPEGWATTHAGETNGHGGALAGRTADGDRSTMFFDDLFHGGKPKTGSRPFCGEEGLEDLVDNFCRDGSSVVLDEDLDFDASSGAMLCHLDVEMAAGGHRLAGVLEDAQEDLLELCFIRPHGGDDVGVVFGDVDAGHLKVRTHDHEGALENFWDAAEATIEL